MASKMKPDNQKHVIEGTTEYEIKTVCWCCRRSPCDPPHP
jgi:hypothetical protein